MTPEEQRIAIAEACPNIIRCCKDFNDPQVIVWTDWEWRPDENHAWRKCYLNDPLADLNVIHEVEKTLSNFQRGQYLIVLNKVCSDTLTVSATASQRAEALVLTIGKWK